MTRDLAIDQVIVELAAYIRTTGGKEVTALYRKKKQIIFNFY